jgi:FeS assembly SUF system protein
MTDLEDRKPDAEAPAPDDIKACVGATGGADSASASAALPPEEVERLKSDIVGALKTVYDPEIPVDIYELGLIYRLDVDDDRNIAVDMTLTAPGCPVAGEMPGWVENAVSAVPGVGQVKVNLVFDPPWDTSRMSDAAKLDLNMF